jgi:hypothetical protein
MAGIFDLYVCSSGNVNHLALRRERNITRLKRNPWRGDDNSLNHAYIKQNSRTPSYSVHYILTCHMLVGPYISSMWQLVGS